MSFLAAIGDWLEDSGHISLISKTAIPHKVGKIAYKKGSHISRAQWAHHVTVCSLNILLKKAWDVYKLEDNL